MLLAFLKWIFAVHARPARSVLKNGRRLAEETSSGNTNGRSKGKRQHAPDFAKTGNMVLVVEKREPREKTGLKNDVDDAEGKRGIRRSRF